MSQCVLDSEEHASEQSAPPAFALQTAKRCDERTSSGLTVASARFYTLKSGENGLLAAYPCNCGM